MTCRSWLMTLLKSCALKRLACSRRGVKITSLPFELLEAVMFKLDWMDILRIRRVCSVFYEVSRSHVVWRNLLNRLSDSYTIPILVPKPIDCYSSSELENLVTKWLRADWGWSPSSRTELPPLRPIRTANHTASFILVEGGRWFIISDSSAKGTVLCYDLDSESPDSDASVLIQGEDDYLVTGMDICIDHSSKGLQFNLALAYDQHQRAALQPPKVSIWRVVLDEASREKPKLFATHTTSFRTQRAAMRCTYISLSGSNYARFVGPGHIEVYDWKGSNSSQHLKCRLAVIKDARRVQLLPGRKLLVVGAWSLVVYRTTEPVHCAVDGLALDSPREDIPLYVFSIGEELFVRGNLSSLHMGFSGSGYLAFATTDGIYALVVHPDCDCDQEASITKLIDYAGCSDNSYALGAHRTYVRDRRISREQVMMMNFLKGSGGYEDTVKEYVWDGPCASGLQAKVDEWSGRVVDCIGGAIFVIDFSL